MKSILAALLFFVTTSTSALDQHNLVEYARDVRCLAETIYREARGEPFRGKIAVGKVVVNRVNHPNYPSTICKVVFQPHQFSWVPQFRGFKAPQEFVHLADDILKGKYNKYKFTATHFHANYVSPRWGLKRVAIIGNHIFYR